MLISEVQYKNVREHNGDTGFVCFRNKERLGFENVIYLKIVKNWRKGHIVLCFSSNLPFFVSKLKFLLTFEYFLFNNFCFQVIISYFVYIFVIFVIFHKMSRIYNFVFINLIINK